jgi:hypothetical protein
MGMKQQEGQKLVNQSRFGKPPMGAIKPVRPPSPKFNPGTFKTQHKG